MNVMLRVAIGAVMLVTVAAGLARLPDEGLKRAQQAERLLQAGQVDEAIKTLEALAKDYPAEAAVHLRLAQVFDIRGMSGPALHCYRRYVELTGERAREEARIRVQTLELVASARDEAEVYAKSRRETTRAVSTPTPLVRESVEVMRPDGSTAPLTPESLPQVLAEHAGATSTGTATELAGPVFPGEAASQARGEPVTQDAEPVPTLETSQLRPSGKRSQPPAAVLTPQSTTALPPPPTPNAPAGRFRGERVRISIEGDAKPPDGNRSAQRAATPAAPQNRAESPEQLWSPSAPRATPDARTAQFVRKLFRESRGQVSEATVELVNRYQMTVITFGAIPFERGEPVNMILSTGERRSITLAPGLYDVMITVTGTTYPPTTLADRRFEFEFRGGTRYVATLTPELFE